jgi:hypothetical protein
MPEAHFPRIALLGFSVNRRGNPPSIQQAFLLICSKGKPRKVVEWVEDVL